MFRSHLNILGKLYEFLIESIIIFSISKKPFDNVMLHYNDNGKLCNHPKAEEEVCTGEEVSHSLEQTLWPDHAVMNTPGAELASKLVVEESDLIVRKGHNCEV